MFAKDLTGCFSHCCVEGGDHCIHVCIFTVHDCEWCKLPAYHSLERFQHNGIFRLFEVKLESCVFWLADSFRQRWKVVISKSWSLPTSAPGKLRVLAQLTPDRKCFLARMLLIWLWCWAMPCPSSGCWKLTQSFGVPSGKPNRFSLTDIRSN